MSTEVSEEYVASIYSFEVKAEQESSTKHAVSEALLAACRQQCEKKKSAVAFREIVLN
jgi:hypothetical protein